MNLPNDFDTLPEAGDFKKPPPDSYVCKVILVKATQSKSGRPMLVLDLDIAEGPFSGWYTRDNDHRADMGYEPKWLRMYQLADGKSAGLFKRLLKNFERSNPKYQLASHINGKIFDEQSLKDLLIGVLCNGEEYEFNGKIHTSIKPDSSFSVDQIHSGSAPIARIKNLDGSWRYPNQPVPERVRDPPTPTTPDDVDEVDIPF